MRLPGLSVRPGYVLSDGFRVPGLPVPSLPVVGGDAAAACIAAASVLAKVSRDRLMVKMESSIRATALPSTRDTAPLRTVRRSPSWDRAAEHRYSFINVRRLVAVDGEVGQMGVDTVLVPESNSTPNPSSRADSGRGGLGLR